MTFVMNYTLMLQKLQASISRFHMQIRTRCFPVLTSFAMNILHVCHSALLSSHLLGRHLINMYSALLFQDALLLYMST